VTSGKRLTKTSVRGEGGRQEAGRGEISSRGLSVGKKGNVGKVVIEVRIVKGHWVGESANTGGGCAREALTDQKKPNVTGPSQFANGRKR